MKDFQKVCGLIMSPQRPRLYSAHILGGCEYGYKGIPKLCKRCIHNKTGYYSTADAITHRNINAAKLFIISSQRAAYARKNGKGRGI